MLQAISYQLQAFFYKINTSIIPTGYLRLVADSLQLPASSVHLRYTATMLIYKEFTFDSAHFLPNVPDGHKCKEMHGHTYRLRVWIEDQPDPNLGWVMDFAVLKKIVKPVVARLDHKCMNDVPGLSNPTCELIAVWIWDQLKPSLPKMIRLELHETPTSGVIYEGR